MNNPLLRRIAILAAVLLVFGGGAYFLLNRSDEPPRSEMAQRLPLAAGPFRLAVSVEPERPVVGDNRLVVLLRTADGQPVTGASVNSVAVMPAMGAMPAMRAPADMEEVAPGRYEAEFQLSMEGAWPVTIDIAKDGVGTAKVSFDMATERSGLRLISGATALAPSGAPGATRTAGAMPFTAGPFQFAVEVDPLTPVAGDNSLIITLQTAEGKPVTGATITTVAEMPAMGAMPAMRAPAEMKEVSSGRYEEKFYLGMEGSWPLRIRIEKEGLGAAEVVFDMATGRAGLRLSSGARAQGATAVGGQAPPGTIAVDSRRRQAIGLKTAIAEEVALTRAIRAVGKVTYDETKVSDVTLKFDGWIGNLRADYVGKHVERGDVLFTVFSPKLFSAQQEYLEAAKRAARGGSKTLLAAVRERLRVWDLTASQITALERAGKPLEYIPIHAPRSGTVISKDIVEGAAQVAGTTLLRIADLSEVWVEAAVYESDLPLIKTGMAADVTIPYQPGVRLTGTVDDIYPYLNPQTRTGRVRLSFDNAAGDLKPDMYAEVALQVPLGTRLAVPDSAVIVSGENRVVFEDLGDGRLAPRFVQEGQRAGGFVEIRSGLEPGARVVTSGTFLIASESKLKAGLAQW